MKTFKGFINYGVIGSEKRARYTAGNPQPTATVSDAVEYTIPEGWELDENACGDPIITAPWGWTYDPNDLIDGKESPYFAGVDKDGRIFKIKLDYRLL